MSYAEFTIKLLNILTRKAKSDTRWWEYLHSTQISAKCLHILAHKTKNIEIRAYVPL